MSELLSAAGLITGYLSLLSYRGRSSDQLSKVVLHLKGGMGRATFERALSYVQQLVAETPSLRPLGYTIKLGDREGHWLIGTAAVTSLEGLQSALAGRDLSDVGSIILLTSTEWSLTQRQELIRRVEGLSIAHDWVDHLRVPRVAGYWIVNADSASSSLDVVLRLQSDLVATEIEQAIHLANKLVARQLPGGLKHLVGTCALGNFAETQLMLGDANGVLLEGTHKPIGVSKISGCLAGHQIGEVETLIIRILPGETWDESGRQGLIDWVGELAGRSGWEHIQPAMVEEVAA